MIKSSVFLPIALLSLNILSAGEQRHSAAEDVVDKLIDKHKNAVPVWPGYSPLERPILLADETGAGYLINYPKPTKGFTRIDKGNALPVYKNPRFQRPAESVFLSEYVYDGVPVFYVRRLLGATPESTLNLVSHETFHSFQHNRFAAVPAAKPATSSAAQHAAFYIEELLLAKALISPDSWQDDFRLFLAARRDRLKRQDTGATAWEDQSERLEGSAQYVELKYSEPAGKAGSITTSPDTFLANMLLMPVEKQNDKVKYYLTGAAQMRLLDRLRAPWKSRLEAGTPIYQLALEQYRTGLPDSAQIDKTYKKYNYQALVASFENVNAAMSRTAAADAKSFSAGRGKLSLISWDARTFTDEGFSGDKQPVKTNDGVFYPSVSTMEFLRDTTLRLIFRNTSVMKKNLKIKPIRDLRGAVIYPTLIEGNIGEGQVKILVDGKETSPSPQGVSFRELQINGEKVSFKAARPGRIYSEADSITVELTPNKRP
ncbi:MAG: hypothetical protein M0011_02665 [Elusimicrobia bacterium]|nr:hypothetical protein [Elusimicrobiota bacterium]